MSIADKITSIETHLSSDYEGLENIGADLTGINKNIQNIRTILDTIYNDMPKVTGEGTEVTLTPTRKGRLALIPKGNSTQESTTGKNILPAINLTEKTIGGNVKITPVYDSNNLLLYINVNGTCTTNVSMDIGEITFEQNKVYTLSGITGWTYNTLQLFTNSSTAFPAGNRLQCHNGKTTKTAQANETAMIGLFLYDGQTYNNVKVYPMVCENNTDDTYEPYSNGQAPNPSYPFPIKSVTGNNNVVVQNKNLLLKGTKFIPTNNNWYDNFGVVSNNITALQNNEHYYDLKANQPYTIKVNEYANVSNWQLVYISGGNISALVYKGINVTDTKTFTPSADTRAWFRINTENPNVETYCYAQLELGSTATSYEEHKEQTKPLNLIGKNLFNINGLVSEGAISNITSNSFTITRQSSSRMSNAIALPKPIPSGTTLFNSATLTDNTLSKTVYVQFGTDSTFSTQQNNTINNSITLNNEMKYVRVFVLGNEETVGNHCTVNNMQIEIGSTATEYTPYWKIELNKTGTYQDYIYKTSGKNLWGGFTFSKTNGGVTCTQNTDGTITLSGTASANATSIYTNEANSNGIYTTLQAGTYSVSGGISNDIKLQVINCTTGTAIKDNITSSASFTLTEETQLYIRVIIASGTATNITIKPMLSKGTDTTYEPYGSGEWYKKEKIIEIIADGVNVKPNSVASNAGRYYTTFITSGLVGGDSTTTLSTHFISGTQSSFVIGTFYIIATGERLVFRQTDQALDTKEKVETWLQAQVTNGTPVKFKCALTTPQDIEITDTTLLSQLEEIDKMQGYNGTTIITSTFDSNNAQMIISASALKGE